MQSFNNLHIQVAYFVLFCGFHLCRFTRVVSPVSFHLCRFTCAVSPVPFHLCRFTCAVSPVPFHLCRFTCVVSPVSFHLCRFTCAVSPVSFHLCRFTCAVSPSTPAAVILVNVFHLRRSRANTIYSPRDFPVRARMLSVYGRPRDFTTTSAVARGTLQIAIGISFTNEKR